MVLSDKQRKIVEFIADFVGQHPYPPSVRQIQDGSEHLVHLGGGLPLEAARTRGLY